MSLIAVSTLESARRKFFLNSTDNMCKNLESNVFMLRTSEMSLTVISSLESARRKFFMNSTYILSSNWESNVFR